VGIQAVTSKNTNKMDSIVAIPIHTVVSKLAAFEPSDV
jgi:hypothetical protein